MLQTMQQGSATEESRDSQLEKKKGFSSLTCYEKKLASWPKYLQEVCVCVCFHFSHP